MFLISIIIKTFKALPSYRLQRYQQEDFTWIGLKKLGQKMSISPLKLNLFYTVKKTSIQQIDLYDSFELGRFLALDGLMITNEKDEFIYHEMITHPALSVNPYIKHVLIIGGGDGGTLRISEIP